MMKRDNCIDVPAKYTEKFIYISTYYVLMGYRTIILDNESYAKLSKAKEALRKKTGRKLSFGETITDLLNKRPELLPLNDELRSYISKFASVVSETSGVTGILLFGSVAKGAYNENSDIDIMVLAKQNSKILKKTIDAISSLKAESDDLMRTGLPSLISPFIIYEDELLSFRPFYFDLADYGIILFEKNNVLSDFIYSVKRVTHKRELLESSEVITW